MGVCPNDECAGRGAVAVCLESVVGILKVCGAHQDDFGGVADAEGVQWMENPKHGLAVNTWDQTGCEGVGVDGYGLGGA